MTAADLWSTYGNLVILAGVAMIGYVVWREKTAGKIAQLQALMDRLDADVARIEREVGTRRTTDVSVTAALASINTQLDYIHKTVNEIKTELSRKADKEHTS